MQKKENTHITIFTSIFKYFTDFFLFFIFIYIFKVIQSDVKVVMYVASLSKLSNLKIH